MKPTIEMTKAEREQLARANAAIAPKNPAHHHGLGLPAEFYNTPGSTGSGEKLTPAEQAALEKRREGFRARMAAGKVVTIGEPVD